MLGFDLPFDLMFPALKLATIVVLVAALFLASRLLLGADRDATSEQRLRRQSIMLALTLLAMVLVILLLPTSDQVRGQLLSLLGLLLTGVVGISSTTFVSNAMAGLMIRTMRHFRPGDFVRIGDHLGRITVLGLFHTELQTEDRDLAVLPNMYLISQPIHIVRGSGTIISATVSLGYDTAHQDIEKALITAAESSELSEPFVRIDDLGDFSVVYRVSGFLEDTARMLTVRSNLRRSMLDTLHGAGIEIVSPSFMNQRVLDKDLRVLPARSRHAEAAEAEQAAPESIIFDKAEAAKRLDDLRRERERLQSELEELEARAAESKEEETKHALAADIERHKARIAAIEQFQSAAEQREVEQPD